MARISPTVASRGEEAREEAADMDVSGLQSCTVRVTVIWRCHEPPLPNSSSRARARPISCKSPHMVCTRNLANLSRGRLERFRALREVEALFLGIAGMKQQPASVVLASALAAKPEELKHEWHKIGESLSCCEFAYLVSHVLGGKHEDNPLAYSRPQEEFLAGCAELFSEALVSQADKSTISWRAFSQALVSATLAAGPPDPLVTDARLTRHKVTLEGVAVEESRVGGGAKTPQGAGPNAPLPPLTVSSDAALFYMPPPMDRLLACETRNDVTNLGARFKVSLFQLGRSASGADSCFRSNVLLEHAPSVGCVALVPTVRPLHESAKSSRHHSVAALATGISIAVGSTHRSLTIWVLATPPGASDSKRKFRIDDTISLGTPAPVAALAAGTSASGSPLLYGGTGAGTVLCWDVATWSLRQTFPAHTSETSCLVALPSLQYIAAAYTDGTIKVWPHGATLADRHTNGLVGTSVRAINAIAWSTERQQLIAAAGRRVHIWNPVLEERVTCAYPCTHTQPVPAHTSGACLHTPTQPLPAHSASHPLFPAPNR